MRFAARTTTTLVAVLAAMAVAFLAAFSGTALGSAISVIRDCSEDGVLNGKYSSSELERALDQLPSDLDEYTDCRAVIRRAQLGSAGGKHRSAKPSAVADRVDAGSPATAGEEGEIAKATGADEAVRIGGTGVRPGESGAFDSAGFGTDLPPLVLILLIALGVSTLAMTALTGRRHLGGVKRGISRFRR
jgi:hypothetical protein